MRYIGCGLAGVIRKERQTATDDCKASPSHGRLVRRSTFFQGEFPKEMSESLTPASLEQDGFARFAEEYYRKDFSGVLELTIGAMPGRGHFYRWHIDIDHLEKVNDELLTVKNHNLLKTPAPARDSAERTCNRYQRSHKESGG